MKVQNGAIVASFPALLWKEVVAATFFGSLESMVTAVPILELHSKFRICFEKKLYLL